MSGIKPQNLSWFYRRIHARGVTAETLALRIASGRTHVTEVLNGTKDSARTRRRLAPLLRPAERELLRWTRDGELMPADVPRGTLSPERLCAEVAP